MTPAPQAVQVRGKPTLRNLFLSAATRPKAGLWRCSHSAQPHGVFQPKAPGKGGMWILLLQLRDLRVV